MTFAEIPGLETTKAQLIQSVVEQKVAHAQLFAGTDGGPNLAMALAYAQLLNCQNPSDDGACNACDACSKSSKLVHPDIHFVLPVCSTKEVGLKDAKSSAFLSQWRDFAKDNPYGSITEWTEAFGGQDKQAFISVEESREIIRSLSLMAFEGNFKIVVIWLPELMRAEGANAILKILEEPPEKTVFILVSNQADALLPTITSRTQRLHIPNFSDDEVKRHLTTGLNVTSERAVQIAHLANGNLRLALSYVEGMENDASDWFRQWMRACYMEDLGNLVGLSDDFHRMSKIEQKGVIDYGLSILRESLVAGTAREVSRVEGKEAKFVTDFGGSLDYSSIEKMYDRLNTMRYLLERNASAKIQILDLSIYLSKIFSRTKQEVNE